MDSFTDLFDAVKNYCREIGGVGDIAMKLWINSLEPVEFKNNTAVFMVQSEFQKTITLNNYEKLLLEAFSSTLGFDVDIKIIIEDEHEPSEPVDIDAIDIRNSELEQSYEYANYDYTFDTFIVGRSNEFAYAACTAVAKNMSNKEYNPLFIYGPSGLGKTHLLTAIMNEIRQKNPDMNIIFVTAEAFANELISAIQAKNTAPIREKFRKCDLLLLDDVQFLAGRESTQTEFFHTFNDLYQANKQIVLTSDRPPKDIKTLSDRLRNRFESGIIADISIPDFETRIAIIKRKAELLDIKIPNDVAEFIANRLKSNIRQLEGAVKKLKALKHLAGSPPSMAMAQSVIRDILNDDQPIPVTIEKIIGEVANIYGVSPDDIRSNKRSSHVSTARKVAIYVVREITQMSLACIGTEFGGRDHSTMVYCINSIETSLSKDAHLKEIVDDIIKNIRDKNR